MHNCTRVYALQRLQEGIPSLNYELIWAFQTSQKSCCFCNTTIKYDTYKNSRLVLKYSMRALCLFQTKNFFNNGAKSFCLKE